MKHLSLISFVNWLLVLAALSTSIIPGLNHVSAGELLPPALGRPAMPVTPAADTTSTTNKAILFISRLRGVEPAAVTVRISTNRPTGAYEIDIAGIPDSKREAELLSKELGSSAVVLLDHVSPRDGLRTNWSFRDGVADQRTAPIGFTGLLPGVKRMHVWPGSGFAAPLNVRVRPAP